MEGFWKFAESQPSMVGVLTLFALLAITLVLAGNSRQKTERDKAFAESEARIAEAKARGQEADAAARKAEARVQEIRASIDARRAGAETGPLV